ncbi:DNA polymerase III subunit delta [Pelagibacteraceae bacterium]|nr:DNA polymerase III subunit delta [Pelagibacteraceae bacterium]
MILKSYIIEKNMKMLDQYNKILFYGENDGLKDDFKNYIRTGDKSVEIINFFQDEIVKNKELLFDKIRNESLFSSEKRIFIFEATDKIFKQIEESLEYCNSSTKIFIFASILDKKSKLRASFEKDKTSPVIACYQDNERTLLNYVSIKLKNIQGINGEILNVIVNNSNCDRKTINNEILKIKTYFQDKKITISEVRELLNIKYNKDFNEIKDASLLGNKIKVNKLLSEIQFENEDTFFYLNNITSRVSKLLETHQINENIKNLEQSIETLKPKIFWKDKPIFIEQAKRLNKKKLQKVLNDVGDAEILIKKNSQIDNSIIIKNLIIDLCSKNTTSF